MTGAAPIHIHTPGEPAGTDLTAQSQQPGGGKQ
jgi:hypothetical protein